MVEVKKQHTFKRFSKKDVPKLRYAMIHTDFGFRDGVSIVMKQVEEVMVQQLHIPKENLFYLVGHSRTRGKNICAYKALRHDESTNLKMRKWFEEGYGGDRSLVIEEAIAKAQKLIREFVDKYRIDVFIAHNTSMPINFILSVALHRYYRENTKKGLRTPKYILWWHDSHLERASYSKPAPDVKRYLLQGVPGPFVEYIIFINSLQFHDAEKYFGELEEMRPGYLQDIAKNHSVVFNTTNTYIDTFDDLLSDKFSSRVEVFLEEFGVKGLLEKQGLTLENVMFCLQHTRMVQRKRIDFALEYCFALFDRLRKKKGSKTQAFYFLISGHDADKSKSKLKRLHKKLSKQYQTDRFFLVFAEDFDRKTTISFDEYPLIFAKLRGFTTYFSEIEGFGNNLLEVLASGLIPVVYTYPVFKKDIAKNGFKLIALDRFEVEEKALKATVDILSRDRKRQLWVNRNLEILRKRFPHKVIAMKLKRAIIRRRTHN